MSASPETWPPPPNPLVCRERLIPEGNRLAREIANLTGLSHEQVIAEASRWNGRSQRLWTMTDDRLARTLNELRLWCRKLKGIR